MVERLYEFSTLKSPVVTRRSLKRHHSRRSTRRTGTYRPPTPHPSSPPSPHVPVGVVPKGSKVVVSDRSTKGFGPQRETEGSVPRHRRVSPNGTPRTTRRRTKTTTTSRVQTLNPTPKDPYPGPQDLDRPNVPCVRGRVPVWLTESEKRTREKEDSDDLRRVVCFLYPSPPNPPR